MITRRSAREALGTNDAGLARFFGVSPSAVSQWGEDDPLPIARQWQARAKRPDIFGSPGQTPPADISRDAGHGRVGPEPMTAQARTTMPPAALDAEGAASGPTEKVA